MSIKNFRIQITNITNTTRVRKGKTGRNYILFHATVLIILFAAQTLYAQENPSLPVTDISQDVNTQANITPVQNEEQGSRRFPLVRVELGLEFLLRTARPGTRIFGNISLDAGWVIGELSIAQGIVTDTSTELFITEFSGHFHLLAIGISDFSYRKYLSGHEARLLGGFSYTKHVRDVLRVDINLGLAYFDMTAARHPTTQYGFQLGARIISNFWRIHNEFSISGYQNVKLSDAGIDLSGTRLSCSAEGSTIDCIIPPREEDPGSYTGVNIISWQHAGVLIEEDMFVNVYETERCQFGPSFTFRYENLPAVGTRIWILGGFRLVWTS